MQTQTLGITYPRNGKKIARCAVKGGAHIAEGLLAFLEALPDNRDNCKDAKHAIN